MSGILGIAVSLGLLMWLAYRGLNVVVLAPVLALLAVLLDGDGRLLATYTQVFMTALGGFVIKYFPLFLLGAVFGRLMTDSGAADAIAHAIVEGLGPQRAILAIVLSAATLTYGGVSVFVVVFAVYPVAARLFQRADIPRRLIPGAVVLGSGTFTMTAMPGTPQIQNALPMPFFGTDLFAAPAMGLVASALMLCGGLTWLAHRHRRARRSGEGYGSHPTGLPPTAHRMHGPTLAVSLAPIAVVIVGTLAFTRLVIPAMDTTYLADGRFGRVTLDDVKGLWALIASLSVAVLLTVAVHWTRWHDLMRSINEGTLSALQPIFNTASEVGYGTVIASLAGFALVRSQVVGLWPEMPLVSEAIAINVLAGITGSASGGLGIALPVLAKTYLDLGATTGVGPELLHRVASIASGGLDTLPHNGAVITILGICHLTHRESYGDIFVVSVVVPIVTLALVILGASVGVF